MRYVRVAPGEMTCRACGETTATDSCPRCSDHEQGVFVRNLVPSLSYLYEGEYISV